MQVLGSNSRCAPVGLQVLYGHTGAVRCGRFTPDGKSIVTGGGEGDATLKVWDPKSGSCTGTIQGHGFHEAGMQLPPPHLLRRPSNFAATPYVSVCVVVLNQQAVQVGWNRLLHSLLKRFVLHAWWYYKLVV